MEESAGDVHGGRGGGAAHLVGHQRVQGRIRAGVHADRALRDAELGADNRYHGR